MQPRKNSEKTDLSKIEQTPFPTVFSIWRETENYPFKLGRNYMKFRSVALVLGAVLFAAVPVWADGILHSELTKESPSILLPDKFDSNNAFDFRVPESFVALDNLFSGHSDMKIDRVSLIALIGPKSSERASFKPYGGDIRPPLDWNPKGHKDNDDPTAVPEPGSFSLVLLGLAAAGVFARGRAAQTRTT